MTEPTRATTAYRVLVVDDDEVMRVLASETLTRIGMEVEEADDGEQALASIQSSPPDLVILDIEMPGQDGLEICRAVRDLTIGRQIPVLIMTGRTDSEIIDQAFQAGANDFIHKPIDWQLLQHRVRFLMHANEASSKLGRMLSVMRDSERRMANAQRLARVGSWEWAPGSEEMLWTEEVHRIFRIPPHAGASTYAAFLDIVHPDDREAIEKAMQRAAAESRPWSLDHRIVLVGGSRRSSSSRRKSSPALRENRCASREPSRTSRTGVAPRTRSATSPTTTASRRSRTAS